MTDEIDRIVAGLSEAQRLAVILWDGGNDRALAGMMAGLSRENGITGLVDAGICYKPPTSPPKATSLTPLGLAVRNRLQENSRD